MTKIEKLYLKIKKLIKIKLVIGLFKILKHNGQNILNYPENNWIFVPFPEKKGNVYNADNLATVNRHNFVNNTKFLSAKNAGEGRWEEGTVRDISWRLNIILWATGRAIRNACADEIFIECGTGRGYMAAAIAEYHNFKEGGPIFYLIDTYTRNLVTSEGITTPSPAEFAYSNNVDEVREYFKVYPSVEVIQGFIPQILEELPQRKIAFLHIDLNNVESEKNALKHLSANLIPGAIIVFDDYGGPGGENQAFMHENFAIENNKELLILPTGQALIIW